jgi:hypothetical protein
MQGQQGQRQGRGGHAGHIRRSAGHLSNVTTAQHEAQGCRSTRGQKHLAQRRRRRRRSGGRTKAGEGAWRALALAVAAALVGSCLCLGQPLKQAVIYTCSSTAAAGEGDG